MFDIFLFPNGIAFCFSAAIEVFLKLIKKIQIYVGAHNLTYEREIYSDGKTR